MNVEVVVFKMLVPMASLHWCLLGVAELDISTDMLFAFNFLLLDNHLSIQFN